MSLLVSVRAIASASVSEKEASELIRMGAGQWSEGAKSVRIMRYLLACVCVSDFVDLLHFQHISLIVGASYRQCTFCSCAHFRAFSFDSCLSRNQPQNFGAFLSLYVCHFFSVLSSPFLLVLCVFLRFLILSSCQVSAAEKDAKRARADLLDEQERACTLSSERDAALAEIQGLKEVRTYKH